MGGSVSVDVRKHFDGIASTYYDIVDRVWYDVGYYHKKEAEFLAATIARQCHLAIDVGCGPGRHTASLAASARRVIAVDISRRMLERTMENAPSRLRSRIDVIQADVRFLPFKSSVVDFVQNIEVLEHLPGAVRDVERAVEELRRILRPGGTLVTEVPLSRHAWWSRLGFRAASWKEIPEWMRDKFYRQFPLTVDHSYHDEELERIFVKAGLRKIRKGFVRVLPAGLIEGHAPLESIDRLMERLPVVNRCSREAIWELEAVNRGRTHGGGVPKPIAGGAA